MSLSGLLFLWMWNNATNCKPKKKKKKKTKLKKTVIDYNISKEFEIYNWIEKIINTSKNEQHLIVCEKLIHNFVYYILPNLKVPSLYYEINLNNLVKLKSIDIRLNNIKKDIQKLKNNI